MWSTALTPVCERPRRQARLPCQGNDKRKKENFKVKHFSGQGEKDTFSTGLSVSFRKVQSQTMTLLEQRNGMIKEGDFIKVQ